jgi:hypothetical protein
VQRTVIDLEFDTPPDDGAPLGAIAENLVSIHDLLRDLAALAADPSTAEYRDIQVVAIEMRRPLTIKLSLLGISSTAVKAFQDLSREVILCREREPLTLTQTVTRIVDEAGENGLPTAQELQRLHDHLDVLRRSSVSLRRVVVSAPTARLDA